MGRTFLRLIGTLCLCVGASAQELSKEDKIFFEGVSAGMMAKHEGDVVDAYLGLLSLRTLAGAEQYRSVLVTRMNTALFAMSFVDRDVTIRPEPLKQLAKISSPNMKGSIAELRKARIDNKWQSSDPKQEESIGWILDRYARTGNVYGFE